jgi:hypothetical protein
MYKFSSLLFIAGLFVSFCSAQDGWKERVNKDGICVLSRPVDGSKLNTIKVVCVIPARLSQLVSVILDVNAGAGWLYSTKSSSLVKQVSPSELYYYSEIAFPWPAANRDFVAHLRVSQNPATKVVLIEGNNISGLIPEKKGTIRMLHSSGKWMITPKEKNLLSVEYILQADPGGTLPAWVTNLFDSKGPYETFKQLRLQVQKPNYTAAHLSFIVD